MKPLAARPKVIALFQAACICAAVEAAIILLLGTFMGSYLGAVGVSLLILGPVSLWIAPAVYRRLLRTDA